MGALIPFNFDGREIRVIETDGEPLTVAKDVAEALGYVWNGAAAIAHVPDEWKGVSSVLTPRGVQQMAVLTEQGLYFFLGRSDKPKALPFQKWMAGDVIPTIRRTGSYTLPTKAPAQPRAQDEALSSVRKAKALQMNIDSADRICARFPHLGVEAQQAVFANVIGTDLIPLPRLEARTYSASEAGEKLGVSANQIGRLANLHELKTIKQLMMQQPVDSRLVQMATRPESIQAIYRAAPVVASD